MSQLKEMLFDNLHKNTPRCAICDDLILESAFYWREEDKWFCDECIICNHFTPTIECEEIDEYDRT